MTRKDFEFIARVVSRVTLETSRKYVAYDFAVELARTNPSFDREWFLKACGI